MKQSINAFFRRHPTLSIATTAILFIFGQSLFSFCSKVHCKAFSDVNYDAWFPYTQNQPLIFVDSSGQADSITITSCAKSPAETITMGFESRGCSIYGSIASDPSTYRHYTLGIYESLLNDTLTDFRLDFGGLYVISNGISDTGLVAPSTSYTPVIYASSFYKEYTLGNKTWPNVQEIIVPESNEKTNRIYKLWLAKNTGIIGYEEMGGDRWLLNNY